MQENKTNQPDQDGLGRTLRIIREGNELREAIEPLSKEDLLKLLKQQIEWMTRQGKWFYDLWNTYTESAELSDPPIRGEYFAKAQIAYEAADRFGGRIHQLHDEMQLMRYRAAARRPDQRS